MKADDVDDARRSGLGRHRGGALRPGLPARLPSDRQPPGRRGPHAGRVHPRLPLARHVRAGQLPRLDAPDHHQPLPRPCPPHVPAAHGRLHRGRRGPAARAPRSLPESAVHDADFDPDIEAALASLPEEFRVAVVLCDVEGLSYEEISDVLGIKLGTVRSRIHRGRTQLREALAHRAPGRVAPGSWDRRRLMAHLGDDVAAFVDGQLSPERHARGVESTSRTARRADRPCASSGCSSRACATVAAPGAAARRCVASLSTPAAQPRREPGAPAWSPFRSARASCCSAPRSRSWLSRTPSGRPSAVATRWRRRSTASPRSSPAPAAVQERHRDHRRDDGRARRVTAGRATRRLAGGLHRVSGHLPRRPGDVALRLLRRRRPLNLFEQNGVLDPAASTAFEQPRAGATSTCGCATDAPCVVTWDADGVVYTIVTDVDRDRVDQAVARPAERPGDDPSPVDRVGDGLSRMTAWVARPDARLRSPRGRTAGVSPGRRIARLLGGCGGVGVVLEEVACRTISRGSRSRRFRPEKSSPISRPRSFLAFSAIWRTVRTNRRPAWRARAARPGPNTSMATTSDHSDLGPAHAEHRWGPTAGRRGRGRAACRPGRGSVR